MKTKQHTTTCPKWIATAGCRLAWAKEPRWALPRVSECKSPPIEVEKYIIHHSCTALRNHVGKWPPATPSNFTLRKSRVTHDTRQNTIQESHIFIQWPAPGSLLLYDYISGAVHDSRGKNFTLNTRYYVQTTVLSAWKRILHVWCRAAQAIVSNDVFESRKIAWWQFHFVL